MELLFALFAAYFVFIFVVVIFMMIVRWKIYVKAGYQGWEAIIPIYSYLVFLKIIGKPWWWILMFFVPIANIVFLIWGINLLSKSFGKDEGFTVGLLFLGIIFYPILAFGNAKYLGPYGDPDAFSAYRNQRQDFDFNQEKFQQ